MNIFFLSNDLSECARYHVDRHTVSQTKEYAQILCTTNRFFGNEAIYKMTHKNHPSCIWARYSLENYMWLCELGLEVAKEYTYRYERIHKSQAVIEWAIKNPPKQLQLLGWTEPTPAMPDEYKKKDSLSSYREYYKFGKAHLHSWKKRNPPEWILT